jgi:hypothetical protein
MNPNSATKIRGGGRLSSVGPGRMAGILAVLAIPAGLSIWAPASAQGLDLTVVADSTSTGFGYVEGDAYTFTFALTSEPVLGFRRVRRLCGLRAGLAQFECDETGPA